MPSDLDKKWIKELGWKNPPTLSDLKADVEEAQSSHDAHVAEVDAWLDARDGKQTVKTRKGRSKIVPKVIRKQAEWRYPGLSEPFLSSSDMFDARPSTFKDKQSAIQNAQILNHQFNNQIDKVSFIHEYVRAPTDEGTVVVELGWETEYREIDVEVEDYAIDEYTGQEIVTGVHIERSVVRTKNQPTLEVCDYRNVIIDPTCNGNVDKAEFIARVSETSKSELKKDGRYRNIDQIVVSSADSLTDAEFTSNDDSAFRFKDEPRKKFVMYRYFGYWDVHGTGKTVPIIAAWVGDVLIRLEESPFPDNKLPFVLVQLLVRRKNVYGEPDGALIEDNQKVIGAVTRGMLDIMGRSANGQVGSRKDALDTVNALKYERGDDYKFNSNIDPNQAFHMGKIPEIPRSAMDMIAMQNNEAESLTGVKAFSSGITGNSLGDNVGGARLATDATAKRELDILRRLGNGMIKIGEKIASMNQEFLDDEDIIRITDEDFIAISRDDLAGSFDITLSISTPESDAEKAKGLEFMIQTLGQSMPFELTQIVLSDIARLKKQPELSKKIAEFKQEPDPMAQRTAELEIMLLEAKVRNEEAKGIENEVDAELKKAKARNLNSKSDNEDLNFLEKESGASKQNEIDIENNKSKNKNEAMMISKMIDEDRDTI